MSYSMAWPADKRVYSNYSLPIGRPRRRRVVPAIKASKRQWKQQSKSKSNQRSRLWSDAFKSAAQMLKRPRVTPKKFFTVGRMGKRFLKPIYRKPSRFLSRGSVRYVEHGGTTSSPTCAYVGHSFGAVEVFATIIDSVIQKLFVKAGHRIPSMENLVSNGAQLGLTYTYRRNHTEGGIVAVNVTIGTTYRITSDNMRASIETVVNTNSTFDDFQIEQFILNDATAANVTLAQLYAAEMIIECNNSSSMSVQNRSLADSAAADPSNRNEITNNPIAGKSYEGRGNGAVLKLWNNTLSLGESLIGAPATGAIVWDVESTNTTTEQKNMYRRPQTQYAFGNVTKSSGVRLSPGQIRNSRLYMKQSCYFNTWIKKLWLMLKEAGVTTQYIPLGHFRFFAFEKKCRTGVGENDISVGFEINNVYRARIVVKAQTTAPTIRIL